MSRSYRHTPILKDGGTKGKKWRKRQASRKVRHERDPIANGKAYCKLYDSWNIADYISYWPKEKAIQSYNKYDWWKEEYPTERDFINRYWKLVYYWK